MGSRQPVDSKIEKGGEQGFTLLEVFFALAIFTFGMLALAAMQVTSIRGNSSSRMHTEEYTWAVDRLEWISGLSYDDGNLDEDASPFQQQEGPYQIQWTVVEDVPIEFTKTIQITVSDINRRSKAVTLNFIKAR